MRVLATTVALLTLSLGLATTLALTPAPAAACDFCRPPPTDAPNILLEYETHKTAAIGTLDGVRTTRRAPFRVTQVLKGPRNLGTDEKQQLALDPRIAMTQKYLLVGPDEGTLEGGKAIPLSDAAAPLAARLDKLPPPEQKAKRLAFLLPHLRTSDEGLLSAVLDEFAKAPYEAVKELAPTQDLTQLLEWLDDRATPDDSRGILILLTGLVGRDLPDPDAAAPGDLQAATAAAPRAALTATLESWMRSTDEQRRPGHDAVIASYLLLRGPAGLGTVRELVNKSLDAGRPRLGGLMLQALRFHTRSETVIPRELALDAMRPFIAKDAPKAAELLTTDVLMELTRLEDWDSLPAVLALYERSRPANMWMTGPVVQYLRACPGETATAKLKELFGIDREAEEARETE